MATKMNAETAKRVKALGINAKDEETAREKLLGILNDNGIEGMEDEDTATLIEIAESFVEDGASAAEVLDETESEDAEADRKQKGAQDYIQRSQLLHGGARS